MQRYWQTLQAQPNFCKVFGSQPLPTEAPKLPAQGTNSSEPKAPKVSLAAARHTDAQQVLGFPTRSGRSPCSAVDKSGALNL